MLKKLKESSWWVALIIVSSIFFYLNVVPEIKANEHINKVMPYQKIPISFIHEGKQLNLKGNVINEEGKLVIDIENSGEGDFYLDLEVVVPVEKIGKEITLDQVREITSFGEFVSASPDGDSWMVVSKKVPETTEYIKIEQQLFVKSNQKIENFNIDLTGIREGFKTEDITVEARVSDSKSFKSIVPMTAKESKLFSFTPKK